MDALVRKLLKRRIPAKKSTTDKFMFAAMNKVEIDSIGCGITAEAIGTDVHVYLDGVLSLIVKQVGEEVIFDTKKEDNRLLPVVFCVFQYIIECGDVKGLPEEDR